MKFRKFLCYVLIFAIMMSLGVTAFADGIALHGNSSIAAITNDEFEALFGTGNADAEYNYNVSRTINLDPSTASHSAIYNVSSQVQYSVTYNIPLSGATSFYVAASNASLSYSLWLTK